MLDFILSFLIQRKAFKFQGIVENGKQLGLENFS